MTKRLMAKKASNSRPLSPGTNFRREESGGFRAEPAESSSAGVTLVDMLAPLFDDADFAVVPLGPAMQRDGQTERRLGNVDILGYRKGLDQLIEVVEQRFRHQVDEIIGDRRSGDEERHDPGGRNFCVLPIIS